MSLIRRGEDKVPSMKEGVVIAKLCSGMAHGLGGPLYVSPWRFAMLTKYCANEYVHHIAVTASLSHNI
jgi:hypothetical protein